MTPKEIKFVGVNNITPPAQLDCVTDPRTKHNPGGLTSSVNFDLTGTSARVRYGRHLVAATGYHSLYADAQRMLGCHDGVLYELTIPANPVGLYSFTQDAPLCYQQASNGWLVISNGVEIVYMDGATVQIFPAPDQTVNWGTVEVPTFKIPLPGSYQLAWLVANLYLATMVDTETWIYYTDAWDFDGVVSDSYYRFKGRLGMMAATDDTLWVSDATGLQAITDGKLAPKAQYTVIPGGYALTRAELFADNLNVPPGLAILATTDKGIYLLGNGGFMQNLSLNQVELPTTQAAVSGIISKDGFNYYATTLQGVSSTASRFNPRTAITIT
jgi:hypothetical protein